MVLFLIVKFIHSTIKTTFRKKEKPRRRRFANFKKICIWGLGEHQQARKGISLSPACNGYSPIYGNLREKTFH